DETVTLHPGANEIEMVATDLVGNVRVERWQVVLDQEPPLLVRQSLSRERVAAGEPVTVEVVASDASGLKKAAPFTVEIGSTAYTGFLEVNRSGGSYRATVIPPRGAEGRVRLTEVELEDYAGTRKRYTFK
ncbi:MAG TPA: hypothetical protein VFG47_05180, partial [Geminicoccaceae bacterium]|nr:hypothetical protein [Geminicoccaceae bacterium]